MEIDSGNGQQELPAQLNRASWRQVPAKPFDRWIVGVDLGQVSDPTAIAVLNHRVVALGTWTASEGRRLWREDQTEHFDIKHLERLPLGSSYPSQVSHVGNLLSRAPLNGAKLVVDETGVGRPVCDLFEQAGLRPARVTITGGLEQTQTGSRSYHVPKGVLISALEARLHTGELKIAAALTDAPALQSELEDFQRKVNEAGRPSYNARQGAHDDLVLSCAIALWYAVTRPSSEWSLMNNAF
jgi:hypothetical protein